jgi:hypothetical protein
MTEWNSLEQVLEAFSLPSPTSLPVARAALLSRLAEFHPDKTSGEFVDTHAKQQYHHVKSAIDYIDAQEKTSAKNLPTLTASPDVLLPAKWEQVRATENTVSLSIKSAASAKFRNRKIASAVVAVAIFSILSFSQKLAANPLIAKTIAYSDTISPSIMPCVGFLLFIILLIAVGIFTRSWRRELKYKIQSENIVTDQGLSELFKSYPLKRTVSESGQFSSTDILDAIQSNHQRLERWLYKLLPPIISKKLPYDWKYGRDRNVFADDPVLAQQATDLLLEKLELRGAIARTASDSFVPTYKLSDTAQKQLYPS